MILVSHVYTGPTFPHCQDPHTQLQPLSRPQAPELDVKFQSMKTSQGLVWSQFAQLGELFGSPAPHNIQVHVQDGGDEIP